MAKQLKLDPADDGPHPWAETRRGNRIDSQLRRAGFEIDGRPKVGEPTWLEKATKKIWLQSEALEHLRQIVAGEVAK